MPPKPLHPRTVFATRYWDRVALGLRHNREQLVISQYQPEQHSQQLFSYLNYVNGTLPEKLLLQELVDRGIGVMFSPYIGDLPFTSDVIEKARPDFLLPDYKIIINVDGIYWHSRPGKAQSDMVQAALYTAAGWDVRVILDVDIMYNVQQALDNVVPELMLNHIPGNRITLGTFNPAAPLAARIKRIPKKGTVRYRTATIYGYQGGKKPRKAVKAPGPLFTGFGPLDIEYVKKLKEWGQAYKAWLLGLRPWVDWITNMGTALPATPSSYVWIGNPDYIGDVDIKQDGEIIHHGHGYWRVVRVPLTEAETMQLNLYFKFRNWWKKWRL